MVVDRQRSLAMQSKAKRSAANYLRTRPGRKRGNGTMRRSGYFLIVLGACLEPGIRFVAKHTVQWFDPYSEHLIG